MGYIAKRKDRIKFTKEVPVHVIEYYNDVADYYYNHPDGSEIVKWIDIAREKNGNWKLVLRSGTPDKVYKAAARLAKGLERYLRENTTFAMTTKCESVTKKANFII